MSEIIYLSKLFGRKLPNCPSSLEDCLCRHCEQKGEEEEVGSPLHTGSGGAEPSYGSRRHPFPPRAVKQRDLILHEYSLDGKPQKSIEGDHCCKELMQHLAVKITAKILENQILFFQISG